jgi:hypothetical protein
VAAASGASDRDTYQRLPDAKATDTIVAVEVIEAIMEPLLEDLDSFAA